jgi:hypothetical protein
MSLASAKFLNLPGDNSVDRTVCWMLRWPREACNARVCGFVGQRKTTGVAQHVMMSRKASLASTAARSTVRAKPAVVNGAPPLAGEQEPRIGILLALQLAQAPQFIADNRMGGRRALLEPPDVQDSVGGPPLPATTVSRCSKRATKTWAMTGAYLLNINPINPGRGSSHPTGGWPWIRWPRRPSVPSSHQRSCTRSKVTVDHGLPVGVAILRAFSSRAMELAPDSGRPAHLRGSPTDLR